MRGALIPVFTPISSSRSTHRTRIFMDGSSSRRWIYQSSFTSLASGQRSVEAEPFLNATDLDRRRPCTDDRSMGIRDDARADLGGAIVRGRDPDRPVKGGLQELHLSRPRMRM